MLNAATPATPNAAPNGLVGFLYNHDDVHQVAHTAPLISALQQRCPDLRIEVLTSSDAQAVAVAAHLNPALPPPIFRRHRDRCW